MEDLPPTLSVRSASAAQTRALGAAIAAELRAGDVVLLSGELGAGKTTLVKGVVEALGGGDCVTSPTFTLCHLYPTDPPVAHVDCWRMQRLGELADLGLDEVLDDGAVAIVEWGEVAAPLYGEEALVVVLAPLAGAKGERRVSLAAGGSSWPDRLRALGASLCRHGLEVDFTGAT